MADVEYPQVKVRLVGEDGNAFMIIGRVTRAMRDARLGPDAIKEFTDEAMSGDYDHLLQTVLRTVSMEDDEDDDLWDDDEDDWAYRTEQQAHYDDTWR